MPYDPVTGEYKEEESDVAKRMTGLLSKDNKYMQQAATKGKKAANRRGLLNSTMAVTAIEDSRIAAALPIASQDAAQAHERGLQGRNIQYQDISQQRDIGSREGMQERDISSREGMQEADITSREGMQAADITSREGMHAAEISSRELMQGVDITSREGMQVLDIDSRERIAGMNINANDRNAAGAMATNIDAHYMSTVTAIHNNPDMPAAERQRALDHAADVRDSGYALLEQIFGVDLEWDTPTSGPPPITPPEERD